MKSSKWKSVCIIHKQDMVGVSVDMVAVTVVLACFVGGFGAHSVLVLRTVCTVGESFCVSGGAACHSRGRERAGPFGPLHRALGYQSTLIQIRMHCRHRCRLFLLLLGMMPLQESNLRHCSPVPNRLCPHPLSP